MKLIATLTMVACTIAVAGQTPHYRDTLYADSERVEALLQTLTLDEKIGLLSTNLGVERLGIPACGHFEGIHGLTLGGAGGWGGKVIDENGRERFTDLPTTVFPQAYGLGATWSVDIMRRVGEQTGIEARYYFQSPKHGKRALVVRAPNADLARDPRWGRTEECFGEDPFLAAEMTKASVQGMQGDNPRYWRAAALLKHFLANSNEDGRDSTSSDFTPWLFDNYYAYPFRKAITEGGSRAFMAAYNAWNGTPMAVHPCLEQITRNQWGNNGIICTDGGALSLLMNAHKSYATFAEGAAAVVKATTGQFLDKYEPYIREALQTGILTEADIDKAIRGNLHVALKLGLLDDGPNPYTQIGTDTTATPPYLMPEVHQFVRHATAQSAVLLKNGDAQRKGILPLGADVKRIAVIGQLANEVIPDWYGGTPPYQVTILEGLRAALPHADIRYAASNSMDQATALASWADVAIVCVGNHPYGVRRDWKFSPVPSDGKEAVDRKSMMLPDEDLVKLVFRSNPNTALVLVSSFPYTIGWSNQHLPSILHITHCSQELGNGVADIITGKANPAGRTVQTWVNDICDLTPMMDYDITHGKTYLYFDGKPLYPFGYGLSYTTFNYKGVRLRRTDTSITLSVSVQNTGSTDGDEVIQVYALPDKRRTKQEPIKMLRGFCRTHIPAGDTKTVDITISIDELTPVFGTNRTIELRAGGASDNLPVGVKVKL